MRLVTLLALAACSSNSSSSFDDKPAGSGSAATTLEQLISTDAISVMRQPGREMFALSYVDQLIVSLTKETGTPPCWTQLIKRVNTGHMLQLAKGNAYFVIEGDLPVDEVLSCVKTVGGGQFTTSQEGELYVVKTPVGVAYAVWRKPYVVIGNREQVKAALETPTAETATRWRDLITPMGSAPTYMVRIDHTVDDIVGAHTTSYAFTVDRLKPPPKPFFAGRFLIHYATPADAEAGERWIREWSGKGQFPRRIPDADVMKHFDDLAAGVPKTKITRTGTTLEIAFDSDMFGGATALATALQKLGS